MIPGLSAELIPSADLADADDTGRRFLEMVVHSGNLDSPHPSLLSADGLYHTGDLFEEVEPGYYLFRGRSGDWIKTLGGFCDAKYVLVAGTNHGRSHQLLTGRSRTMCVVAVRTSSTKSFF